MKLRGWFKRLSTLRAILYFNCGGVVIIPAALLCGFMMARPFDFAAFATYSVMSILCLNLVCNPLIVLMNAANAEIDRHENKDSRNHPL